MNILKHMLWQTINDVFTAMAAHGLRRYLQDRAEQDFDNGGDFPSLANFPWLVYQENVAWNFTGVKQGVGLLSLLLKSHP